MANWLERQKHKGTISNRFMADTVDTIGRIGHHSASSCTRLTLPGGRLESSLNVPPAVFTC